MIYPRGLMRAEGFESPFEGVSGRVLLVVDCNSQTIPCTEECSLCPGPRFQDGGGVSTSCT